MAHRKRQKEVRQARGEGRAAAAHRAELLRKGGLLGGVGAVFAVVVALLLLNPGIFGGSGGTGVRVGQAAPDFTIRDVDGNMFRLSDQRGHPVLLDFMGSRCPACIQEMPHLVQTYRSFAARGLKMISIDVGGSTRADLGTTDPAVAKAFLQQYGGSWPIALDDQQIGVTFQATSLPTLYVIDAAGVVQLAHPGGADAAFLAAAIEPLL